MAQAHNWKEREANKGKKQLEALKVKEGENGGHIVEHHFGMNDAYHEPEVHVFGADEGEKLMMHIAKHMHIKPGKEESEDGEIE